MSGSTTTLPARRKPASYKENGILSPEVKTTIAQRETIEDLDEQVRILKVNTTAAVVGMGVAMGAFRMNDAAFPEDVELGDKVKRNAAWDLYDSLKVTFESLMLGEEYAAIKQHADKMLAMSPEAAKEYLDGAAKAIESGLQRETNEETSAPKFDLEDEDDE